MQVNGFILDELSEKVYLNKENAESILLDAVESDDEDYAYNAKYKLIQVYGTGKYTFPGDDPWEIPDFPNLDKLTKFVAGEIRCADDISEMIGALYYEFMDIDEAIARAVEAALLAVECNERCDLFFDGDGREEAKIMLFWLYFKGEFGHSDCEMITLPSLMDAHKAAELLRYEVILIEDYTPEFNDLRFKGELDTLLEEAYALHPEKRLIARIWLDRCTVNGEIDKVVNIICNADENTAYYIAYDLLSDWEDLFEYEGEEKSIEEIEKVLLAISEKGAYREFLLSLYQFGSATLSMNDGYEVVHPTLKNEEKATAFAEKYGITLLDEPAVFED